MSPPGPPAMSPPEPPDPGMRFAERQLRRHGWRRGQGLGKREDGIAEAIRVKVKCDTAGVGHDAAEPFSFHWWDHVFNKAAANIAVEAGQDGISMKTVCEEGVRVSNKKPLKASSPGSMLYGRFVKSATLTARGEEPTQLPSGSQSSEEEEEELDLSSARRLTDEELVRACGGRTAHKGARHGLTMSAKLARLEEQERAFLARYGHKEQQLEPPESSPPAERLEKEKKRKRSRGDPEVLQHQESSGEEEEVGWEEGKVMKRKKRREPSEEDVAGEEGVAAKKKKKKQEQDKEESVGTEKKKKKKKKKKKNKEEPVETEVPLEDTDGPDQVGHSPRKKRKKRKREPE